MIESVFDFSEPKKPKKVIYHPKLAEARLTFKRNPNLGSFAHFNKIVHNFLCLFHFNPPEIIPTLISGEKFYLFDAVVRDRSIISSYLDAAMLAGKKRTTKLFEKSMSTKEPYY